ncbi:MAG: NUDIX hydrolase [Planctomycetota bacterium]|jgi:8-oxo-dGTP diphosphatase
MTADFREPHLRTGDFLGAFGVLESAAGILMVQNERCIAGVSTLVWDLPGGQVEPGELLQETLQRELDEELGIAVEGSPDFLFFQEGERCLGGDRHHAWRSFFFRVASWSGEPAARGEVLAMRWMTRDELARELQAPYHDSFLAWLDDGGTAFRSRWCD